MKDPRAPKYDAEEIYGILPSDVRAPYDVHEVIARLVDASEFHAFKALYGSSLVCGFAHIWGMPVGIIANNGISCFPKARKRAHILSSCAASGACLCCSCRISRASWSAANTRPKALPSMAPSW